jgi:hypothetical protein
MRKSLVYSKWWQAVGSPDAGGFATPAPAQADSLNETHIVLFESNYLSDSDLTRKRHWSRYILSPYFRGCDGRIKKVGGVTFLGSEPKLGQQYEL